MTEPQPRQHHASTPRYRVEFTEDLLPFSYAKAYVLAYHADTDDYQTMARASTAASGTTEITVYDSIGACANVDDRGWVFYCGDSRRFELIGIAPPCGSLGLYSVSSQTWDRYNSVENPTDIWGLDHPVQFDVTVRTNGYLYTVEAVSNTFPRSGAHAAESAAMHSVPWTNVAFTSGGWYVVDYELSEVECIDGDMSGSNKITMYWEKALAASPLTYVEQNGGKVTHYLLETSPAQAACETEPRKTFIAKTRFAVQVASGDRIRVSARTVDDGKYQEWQAGQSYLHISKDD
jgi:hypothetical protein